MQPDPPLWAGLAGLLGGAERSDPPHPPAVKAGRLLDHREAVQGVVLLGNSATRGVRSSQACQSRRQASSWSLAAPERLSSSVDDINITTSRGIRGICPPDVVFMCYKWHY